jgi:Uncharacterized protein conserved in bacteria (DUF2334)
LPRSHKLILLLFLAPSLCTSVLRAAPARLTVVFRYDDYSAVSTIGIDRSVISEFDSRRLALTMFVIPYVSEGDVHSTAPQRLLQLDAAKTALLRYAHARGTVDVAVHGYSHQSRLLSEFSEFRGMSEESQFYRISSAKSEVERIIGARVETFAPPWNTYDKATAAAIKAAGFRCLSADLIQPPVTVTHLQFLPATTDLEDLRHVVDVALRWNTRDAIVCALFHKYDFRESGNPKAVLTLTDLGKLLDWLKIQPQVRVVTFSTLLSEGTDLASARLAANRPLQYLPPVLSSVLPDSNGGIYLTTNDAKRKHAVPLLFVFMFLALNSLIAASATTTTLVMQQKVLRRLSAAAIFIAMIAIAAFAYHRRSRPESACFVALCSGVALGIVVNSTRRGKRAPILARRAPQRSSLHAGE